MVKNLLIWLISFILACVLSPIIIALSKKFKAKQTILHYVKEHKSKQGTPTMGGFIFILSTLVVSLCFFSANYLLAMVALAVMISYGLLGFLDDFIKIKYKQNLGLKAYQKAIGQVGIAILIALFAYNSNLVGSTLFVPFTNITIDLGWFIIPFNVFVFLALVNSVNLIDGMDGLASGVSTAYLIAFSFLISFISTNLAGTLFVEQSNLALIAYSMVGALMAYYAFNCFPAKIFMGDTGSLAIGGFITAIAVFSRLTLYVPILGIMYVLTALSDVIQVLHYKRTKRRVFLMAPLHHHFQKKGVHENRIVAIYILTTVFISIVTITLILI